ncbi:MAG: hypothetical protein ACR2JF_01260 [Iamia sp.]
MEGRETTDGAPARVRAAVRRAAVPALLAGVLWWQGRYRAPLLLAAVALVLLIAGLTAPRAMAALDRTIARAATTLADGLFRALAALAWVLTVLPTWALSRAVGHSAIDDGWATRRSAWVNVQESRRRRADDRPARPARMGARETEPAPRVRRRARLRLLPFAAVLIALVVWRIPAVQREAGPPARDVVDLRGDPSTDEVEWNGLPITGYAHEGEPWAEQYFRDLIAAPVVHDYALGLRLRDYQSDLLSVLDGRRVTYQPDDPELTAWYFGGSTMYGIGQRDDHTLPSVVASEAEADGIRIRSLNFGASGDVNWVGTLRFAEALTSGLPPPDLVVFYDGPNDVGLANQRVDSGNIDPTSIERFPLSDAEREIHESSFTADPIPYGPERDALEVELAATQYRRGVETARALAAEAGVPIVHIWQPQPFSKVPGPADDELWERLDLDTSLLPELRTKYAAIRAESGVGPIDLSDALDEATMPVYFDSSHTNELGAAVIGRQLYEALAPQLRQLDGGP